MATNLKLIWLEEKKYIILKMFQLILLRHAKTDQFSATGNDFDRKLLPRGINQGLELADYFTKNNFPIGEVFISGATRTRETFALFESALGKHVAVFSDDLYLCESRTLFNFISTHGKSSTLLVVGHNYGISDFASYLSGEHIDLATSELVRLSFDIHSWEALSKDQGKIIEVFRPSAR